VVKTRLAKIHVWKLEHVVAMHSAEWSTGMPSVHAHQAIMAIQSWNVNKVSYILHTVCYISGLHSWNVILELLRKEKSASLCLHVVLKKFELNAVGVTRQGDYQSNIISIERLCVG
jgi:hypothetical protein